MLTISSVTTIFYKDKHQPHNVHELHCHAFNEIDQYKFMHNTNHPTLNISRPERNSLQIADYAFKCLPVARYVLYMIHISPTFNHWRSKCPEVGIGSSNGFVQSQENSTPCDRVSWVVGCWFRNFNGTIKYKTTIFARINVNSRTTWLKKHLPLPCQLLLAYVLYIIISWNARFISLGSYICVTSPSISYTPRGDQINGAVHF